MTWAEALPVIFMCLMGLAMLVYVILDGYSLGVGLLLHRADDSQKDVMIGSVGPFWEANQTWLVLGIGVVFIAFPRAHGVILTALYLPVALMLIGLIMRGAAFDFRVKAQDKHKTLWNRAFFIGSTMAAVSQGWMLGRYITGLHSDWLFLLFAAVIALLLPAAYALHGACWLVMKTEGELQRKAVSWARIAWAPVVLGMVLISAATPIVSPTVRAKWFTMPEFLALLPIPLLTGVALIGALLLLRSPRVLGRWCWVPFALVSVMFLMGTLGLAYSLYPYVLIDQITIFEAAAATNSLNFVLIGVAITVPMITAYTINSYRVFRGKATKLVYA